MPPPCCIERPQGAPLGEVERGKRERVDALPHEIDERRVDGAMALEARAAAEPVGDDDTGIVAARTRARMPDVLRAVVDDLEVRRREPLAQARLDLFDEGVQSSSVSG
jgi:hypothetical protein